MKLPFCTLAKALPLGGLLVVACATEEPAPDLADTSRFVDDDARIVVTISPASPTTSDLITAEAAQVSSATYTWTLDGEATEQAGPVIDPSLTVKGQRWRVFVEAGDVSGTANTTVVDTPPEVLTGRIGPDVASEPRANLEHGMRAEVVNISTFDADGDTVTVAVTWLADGDEVYIGAVWPAVDAPVGAEITARLRPIADGAEGAAFLTDAVTVIPAAEDPADTDTDLPDTDAAAPDTDAGQP